MKLWEKILEERLREVVKIDECQFGFQEGKSTIDAIFILRQVLEKHIEKKKELFMYLWTWRRLLTGCQEKLLGGL